MFIYALVGLKRPAAVLSLLCVAFAGVEMFNQTLDRAEAGDQVGALMRGIKREDVRRGHVLAKPGTVSMHNHFAAQVAGIDFTDIRLHVESTYTRISCWLC